MNYIIHDKTGKILRTVICHPTVAAVQVGEGEFIMEGTANDVIQKVVDDGELERIVNKTPEEIKAEKPSERSKDEQIVYITNRQWQDVLDRLGILETK